ncbi:MAG: signal peptidase I [Candidatus Melainabacteria bacterium]|jgi:signal peptidase I|nr:signal peptidase I [Candidatus Melainabacteria bacterium]
MNFILDIIKGIFHGIKEGFWDLIFWSKPPREEPAEQEDTSWKKYFSYPEWRFWTVREVTAQITVVLALLIVIRAGVGEFRFIPSESMVPTMLIDDRLFVDKFTRIFKKQYDRGDIIVFYPPPAATGGVDVIKNDPWHLFARLTGLPFLPQPEAYIKRLIGLPGDKLEVRINEGVFINGHRLDEPYHYHSPEYLPTKGTNGVIEIPEGYYYALGDNRNYSSDSRFWGLLPKSRVIGKAAFLIYRPLRLKPVISPAIIDPELRP